MKGLVVLLILGISMAAHGGQATAPARAATAAPGGSMSGAQKPLEVKGQTRTMNMMLLSQGEREKINFVHARTNYRYHISTTTY